MKYLRIKKNTDFQRLFQRGSKVFSPAVTVLYYPAQKLSMGVAVSKKHGKAVQRNRIKRLLRAVFNDNCGILEKPYSIILIPKTAEEYSYKTFENSVRICFKKGKRPLGKFKNALKTLRRRVYNPLVKGFFMRLIVFYQRRLSKHTCLYQPTCSEYTKRAINNKGVILGILYGAWRILRCNPFSKGGFDPEPERRAKRWVL